MRSSRRFAASAAALLIGAAALGWAGNASARTKVIYSFPFQAGALAGRFVSATDPAGNLYGVTLQDGLGYGTIFELVAPTAAGAPWTEQTLYAFPAAASGYSPQGLTRDTAGNLYGAAMGGKVGGKTGGGVIWKLSPPAVPGGSWSFSVLYTFSPLPAHGRGPDGKVPCGSLVLDHAGTLFGTTYKGGAAGGGTVFSLAPPAPGGLAWTETVLHSFPPGVKGLAAYPNCPLTLSEGGRVLYGTTTYGDRTGTVFRLRHQPGGWVYRQIGFRHGAHAPLYPNGGLVVDASGNLFGTSRGGGAHGDGTVFELSPPSGAVTAWTRYTLHSFDYIDGDGPIEGLAVSRGVTALFGTTFNGGSNAGGAIFRLDPPASGSGPWAYSKLYDFGNVYHPHVPQWPIGPLIFGHSHKLFGSTLEGGANESGSVFSQTPDSPQTAQ